MSKRRNKQQQGHKDSTPENFRIYLDEIIRDFINDPERNLLDFPSDYSKPMRAYIHEKCQKLGIKSKSHGKEPNRILSILKKDVMNTAEEIPLSVFAPTHQILSRVQELKVGRNMDYKRFKMQYDSINKAYHGSMTRVQPVVNGPFDAFRKSLPIFNNRQLVLDTIRNNQVVIVSAETGSGKTTQIPQFIIEEAAEQDKEVRVICTQPRRLSTVAVAERVAAERGEKVGHTIGYQIKLEQKLGLDTAIIYCTNGVLLRTLMSGEDCFKRITHIVVDEIHERDKFTDFLMIILRESLKKFPHLRLILMSATMDMDAFVQYFEDKAFVLSVEGRSFSCCSWFLEDILHHIQYENPRMKELRLLRERNGAPGRSKASKARPKSSYAELDEECKMEVNEILARCFDQGADADFDELMQMYLNENVNPNYQDWHGKTALMAASRHGNFQVIEQLLNMGADMFLSSADGITASGWAQQANNMDVVNMLSLYQQTNPAPEMCVQESGILADYDRTVNDEFVDYDLILEIIKFIHFNLDKEGAILVFLPGYEDIVACQDRINNSSIPQHVYKLFMHHGSMQIQHQHDVFQKFANKQKIILATNIAETSITIDDVRFVIDSGKAKIKSYDARTGISSLKSDWISMANSRQRAGRAGRTQNGYCFHLYSINRYESFYVNPIPEILRTPLHELCLQTKMLAPPTMSIAEFLNLAIDPPKRVAVEEAITTLKCLGALDEFETMSELGEHLVQFSIEPRLGKMLIFAVILKCLDPVLTIAASMAQKDPFMLPSQPHLKQLALDKRKSMAEDSLSDHMIYIRAFQLWQDHKVQNRGYQFCNQNFISPAVMELITLTRSQLLSQLRAMGFVQANPKDNISDLNTYSNSWSVVKCCLAAGLYPNVAFYNDRNLHTKIDNVHISGQSSLKGSAYDGKGYAPIKRAWLVFDEIFKPRNRTTVKTATVVTPLTIALICGQNTQVIESTLLLDDSYALRLDNSGVIMLRNNVQHLIFKKINAPRVGLSHEEIDTLKLLVSVLTSEEENFELRAPDGIGKRPKITDMTLKTRAYNEHQHREVNSGGFYQNQYGRQNHRESFNFNYPGPSRRGGQGGQTDLRRLFPANAGYFIILLSDERYLVSGIKQQQWAFSQKAERKILQQFEEGRTIYLVFHVRRSPLLCGVAKLLDTNQGNPSNPCPVEWITTNKIPIYRIKNSLHEKIILQEDGYELEGYVGQEVCMAICDNQPNQQQRRYANNAGPRPILGNNSRPGPSRYY